MSPVNPLPLPFIFIFAGINIIIAVFWKSLQRVDVDTYVLLAANALLLIVFLIIYFIQKKALSNRNPNVFLRSIMSGMLIKMMVCVVVTLLYKFSSGEGFSKNAVFISLLLYLVYLAAEVLVITKLNKRQHA